MPPRPSSSLAGGTSFQTYMDEALERWDVLLRAGIRPPQIVNLDGRRLALIITLEGLLDTRAPTPPLLCVGAAEALEQLREEGATVVLATALEADAAAEVVRDLYLGDYVTVDVAPDASSLGKASAVVRDGGLHWGAERKLHQAVQQRELVLLRGASGRHKAAAVHFIQRYCHCFVAAVGASDDDVEMIRRSDLGIVPIDTPSADASAVADATASSEDLQQVAALILSVGCRISSNRPDASRSGQDTPAAERRANIGHGMIGCCLNFCALTACLPKRPADRLRQRVQSA
eukprot:TRINITY_DN26591_c0_g1_i1.p1 TRINITY_DN26591_c0_g1~~TRINITY_DN26591_c0_g1_i1.p1  ORF type:complete len:289 (-),score=52.64 TRINITY_DN26591_c0_g1_i1:367-1233(-)